MKNKHATRVQLLTKLGHLLGLPNWSSEQHARALDLRTLLGFSNFEQARQALERGEARHGYDLVARRNSMSVPTA
jgi:hypothetical protein